MKSRVYFNLLLICFVVVFNFGVFAVAQENDAEDDIADYVGAFKSNGLSSTIAIFPVIVAEQHQWTTAVMHAHLLERCGASDVKVLMENNFNPDEETNPDKIAVLMKSYIDASINEKADYYMFVELTGGPGRGVTSTATVIINNDGNIVWTKSQYPDDKFFQAVRPGHTLHGAYLVVEALRKECGWGDPVNSNFTKGKWAEYLGQRGDNFVNEIRMLRARVISAQ